MPDTEALKSLLRRLDGRSYSAFKDLKGSWLLGNAEIILDHIQGDPFASPSRIRGRIRTNVPGSWSTNPARKMGVEDWLLRRFGAGLRGQRRGSGRSGEIRVYRPGPEVVRRSAVMFSDDGFAEVRFLVGLPARGRRILGREAFELLTKDVVLALETLRNVGEMVELEDHVASVVNQERLRGQLQENGLIAFIANESILPRRSGVDRSPLLSAVPFRSPPSMQVALEGESGPVEGLGISAGVTLIAGGGFHGKSTLLQAIQWGHLNHIPGDGREQVVSTADTVKVRAEDGRRVERVDISPFLGDLPGGKTTAPFCTDDASGSTSQAAAIVESIETGAKVLLLDEDTSATNLLARDDRMKALVPPAQEPITPFVERVQELSETHGVSTVMVVGGVGAYLSVADSVILMNEWVPSDGTARAKALAGPAPTAAPHGISATERCVTSSSLRPTGKGRVRARDDKRVDYGHEEIDLAAVEQVLDGAHSYTLGQSIRLIGDKLADGKTCLPALLDALELLLIEDGADALSPFREPVGNLIWPRRYEVAAAINRLRTLRVVYGQQDVENEG